MKETINDWEPEVKSLLDSLTDHGAKLLRGDNGEYAFNYTGNLDKFVKDLIACDEARLYVQVNSKRRSLYLVLGNSPGELVCDYACDDVLDKVTEEHYAKWEGRKQPTKVVDR